MRECASRFQLTLDHRQKIYTLKWLLICDIYKRIFFASNAYDGYTHGFTIFKEIFAGFDFSTFQTYVDLGFIGIEKHVVEGDIFIPHKASKNHPLTASQKEVNTELTRVRVVVEHSIAKIKSFFVMRIENRIKMKHKLNNAFHICAVLANLKTDFQATDY